MKKNMGKMDKTLRVIAGLIIMVVGYLNESWWGLVGLIPVLTGFVSFCPAYWPFNFSTLKKNEGE